jgi:hypothetical protein
MFQHDTPLHSDHALLAMPLVRGFPMWYIPSAFIGTFSGTDRVVEIGSIGKERKAC